MENEVLIGMVVMKDTLLEGKALVDRRLRIPDGKARPDNRDPGQRDTERPSPSRGHSG